MMQQPEFVVNKHLLFTGGYLIWTRIQKNPLDATQFATLFSTLALLRNAGCSLGVIDECLELVGLSEPVDEIKRLLEEQKAQNGSFVDMGVDLYNSLCEDEQRINDSLSTQKKLMTLSMRAVLKKKSAFDECMRLFAERQTVNPNTIDEALGGVYAWQEIQFGALLPGIKQAFYGSQKELPVFLQTNLDLSGPLHRSVQKMKALVSSERVTQLLSLKVNQGAEEMCYMFGRVYRELEENVFGR